MFSSKKTERKNQEASLKIDTFIEEMKKDMTNRAAIAAKQESTINKLVGELAADRKELRAMRKLYEARMEMDDDIIDDFMLALEKRKQ